MQVEVLNWKNQVVETKTLDEATFGVDTRVDIISRVVSWQRAKARAGTHKAKDRNEVSGSTRKIYNQKGGGRARHGSIKAPIFIGGGITFGPIPRSHEFSLNKKVRELGLKSILSTSLRENKIILMDRIDVNEKKTSSFIKNLAEIGLSSNTKILMIDSIISDNLKLSSSNLHKVNVLPIVGINVLDIMKHDKIIMTVSAIDNLQTRFAK
jgi:large subunit ribosomal protein L4